MSQAAVSQAAVSPKRGPQLILASGSPRRRELLEQLGFCIDIQPADIDEQPRPNEDPLAYAQRMAWEKSLPAQEQAPQAVVVSADTVVHLDGRIFGKPKDAADAVAILRALSGHRHQVSTGVCVAYGGQHRVRVSTTQVSFRELSLAEIQGYVATGEPMDKAGSYGIQGIGGFLVRGIQGSYSNVVGLPLDLVLQDLAELAGLRPFQEGR